MGQPLTHQAVAREAAAMLVEENSVVKNVNTNREREFEEEINGYKKGDTVRIKVPPTPVVFDGSTFASTITGPSASSAPTLNEGSVSLQLSSQKHTALTFTSKEKKLEMTEFKERYLRPCMNAISAIVNSDLLVQMKNLTPNLVGTPGSVPNTRTVYRNASSVLDRFLAPSEERSIHISSDANDALAEANATLFHTADELRGEFTDNAIGRFAEMNFYNQQSNPVHTNGAGAGYLINGVGVTGSSIPVDTGTGIIPKGTIITIGTVTAVHPLTGLTNGKVRQFVVTSDYAGGAGNLQIYPPITPTTSTVVGTVVAGPADNTAITIVGSASTGYRQNLAFHKNAFAVAFAPLNVLAGCEGYTATVKNVSVRVMTFGDGYNDKENTRVDVLYGIAGVRPDHAVRVTE